MITLREIFDVTWDITEVRVTAREADLHLIHHWIYSGDIEHLSAHQWREQQDGSLSVIKTKVNFHGTPVRGVSEIGWGVNLKAFQPEMLDARVDIMRMTPRSQGRGCSLTVEVTMNPVTVAAIIDREKQWYEEDKA